MTIKLLIAHGVDPAPLAADLGYPCGAGEVTGLELRQLRYFVAVAETGQISLAAQHLYMTQSALSHAVRRLEQQLGVELFDRRPGGVVLTAAGVAVLAEARVVLEVAKRVVGAAQRYALRRPRLVVGFFSELLERVLEPLERFAAIRPDVELCVRELPITSQEHAVRNGDVDIALLCPPPHDVVVEPYGVERIVACVGCHHRLAERTSVTLADLEGEVFPGVHPDVPTYWGKAFAPPSADARGLRASEMPTTPDEVRALVVCGEVVALLPEFLARRHRNAGCVAIPVIDAPPLPLSFASARADDPMVESFVASVRATTSHDVITLTTS